ncbi:hypothetical protein NPX79_00445 [Spiroplasma endosymbiont of Anurida maritima]|uniref:hypothetical protein n=1 Tax=Spiroplasma endosymbiont of Anurida maritima TaxID=2967972 RepID=UPI0036D416F8
MKFITIKSLVSIANLFMYITYLIIFLFFGLNYSNIEWKTAINISYVLMAGALVLLIIYDFVRYLEIKKTTFQLTRKHISYTIIFYIGQAILYFMAIIFVILIHTGALNSDSTRIVWYVFFPITFLASIFVTVLESIVRIEEKIFIAKENWKASEEYVKKLEEQEKLNVIDETFDKKPEDKDDIFN